MSILRLEFRLKPQSLRSCSARIGSKLPPDNSNLVSLVIPKQELSGFGFFSFHLLPLAGYVFCENKCSSVNLSKLSVGCLLWDGTDLSQPGFYGCKIEIVVLFWKFFALNTSMLVRSSVG